MLEQLELRDDRRAVHLTELEDRRPAHPAGDPLGRITDVVWLDGHGRIQPQADRTHRLTGL